MKLIQLNVESDSEIQTDGLQQMQRSETIYYLVVSKFNGQSTGHNQSS